MYLSSEREPVGREFLPEIAWRKAKEIQRLRQDEREMREKTRENDSRKESGNRQDETSIKKGLTKIGNSIIIKQMNSDLSGCLQKQLSGVLRR